MSRQEHRKSLDGRAAKRTLLAAGAVAFLLLDGATLVSAVTLPPHGLMESNGTVRVGRPAPAFAGKDLSGRTVSLESLRGRPALLDFGSIFCPNCHETIREFARLEKAYRDTDLQLVVVTDGAASVETMRNFFGNLNATYTVIRDRDQSVTKAFGVKYIPFLVAVDRDGVVRKLHFGFAPDLEETLDLRALAGQLR
jgi:peroxiredoxin